MNHSGVNNTARVLASRIDHTALGPGVTDDGIARLCREATEFGFLAVCVNPVWVRFAADQLQDTNVQVCSVAGFPLGANLTSIKMSEAVAAAEDGATEIDMVANIGLALMGQWSAVEKEIAEVRRGLPDRVLLKVIVESSLLSESQRSDAVEAVFNGGAQFIKTGTGQAAPVTVQEVEDLVRSTAGRIETKAAGGIRTVGQCRELLSAGATRLGCSASVRIIKELRGRNP